MIHTKRVIFMVLPLLFVPLVYGLSSTPDACAVPPDSRYKGASCESLGKYTEKCCWREPIPGSILGETYCQVCSLDFYGNPTNCDPKVKQSMTTGSEDTTAPLGGGVAEQPEQPPLFGENTNVPPTGGIEQPPTTTAPQVPPRLPGGGANVPTEEGSAEQPPTPQQNQGGGLPAIKNQENVPPGGGVAEQQEDEGQEDSSEGAETAGPLT